MDLLQDEIDKRAREIHTDRYSMSISEAVAMYQDGDLEIHPEFQRIFRWTPEQQSRLIESVFLGIPVPPIFVAQRKDGVWDVVDGVQRLSTIFRFMGVLKDEGRELVGSIPLLPADYLKHLSGVTWDAEVLLDERESKKSAILSEAQRRIFKRARLDFHIVQKESDERAKFDLFQRLNSGTRLSEQEARNCLAVMLDPTFSHWLYRLADYPAYDHTMVISEKKEQESYGVESVLRYLAFINSTDEELSSMGDVGDFITHKMRQFIESTDFDRDREEARFHFIFDLLDTHLGEDSFKRPPSFGAGSRRFSISAFEAISTGLALNYEYWRSLSRRDAEVLLKKAILTVWEDPEFGERAGGGKRANQRIPFMVKVGRRTFAQQD
ncbi:hypothetical protein B1813_13015 [Saccharomonospora piscinae]|uniref:GmrSD restriction endonucleases N-terminal domain-containing protein n=1 Tax=Saccharomonospora piscinae TaxID=687388 RepID=A0A1V9A7K9_SACPI|nr:DUF262 domain-containing protein [Saccharomonospora piscinae]OQO93016.1 hypothetical protein B1813_13015 [Saccharomonospora piscinae]